MGHDRKTGGLQEFWQRGNLRSEEVVDELLPSRRGLLGLLGTLGLDPLLLDWRRGSERGEVAAL